MVTANPTTPAPARRSIWRALMGNMWRSLSGTLGVMQALIVHWLAVVVLDWEGLGPTLGLSFGAVLVVLNLGAVPLLRRARMRGGRGRQWSRLYMAVGISTLLVGLAVTASWLAIFPATSLLGWLGLGQARPTQGHDLRSVGRCERGPIFRVARAWCSRPCIVE